MAATSRTPQALALTGGVLTTYVPDAANGDLVNMPATASALLLRITNGSGASINVTIDDPTSVTPISATQFNPDVTVAVAASATKVIKVADLLRFKTPSGGVLVTVSSATSVTVEASYV